MSSPNLNLHEAALSVGAAYTINPNTRQIYYVVGEAEIQKLVNLVIQDRSKKLVKSVYTGVLNGKSVQSLGHIGYAENIAKELQHG